jgi:RimJ/RimL family protein N-acetyltransferase
MRIQPITTSRLILRPFTDEDAVPLHAILNQQDVLRYYPNPNPPPLERVEKFIQRQLLHWKEHGCGWWAVTRRAEGDLIGWNGLQYLPETDEIEIGFLLGKPYWGQGFATEGGKAGIEFGFRSLKLEQIVGIVHPKNTASQHVLEKLGLTFVEKTNYFGMDVFKYQVERFRK